MSFIDIKTGDIYLQGIGGAKSVSSSAVAAGVETKFQGSRVCFLRSVPLKPGLKQGEVGGHVHMLRAVEYLAQVKLDATETELALEIDMGITRGIEDEQEFLPSYDELADKSDIAHDTTFSYNSARVPTLGFNNPNDVMRSYYVLPLPVPSPVPYYLDHRVTANTPTNSTVSVEVIARVYFTVEYWKGKKYETILQRYTGGYGGGTRRDRLVR